MANVGTPTRRTRGAIAPRSATNYGLTPIQQYSPGMAVVPGAGADFQQNKLMGWGTWANAGKGFFNSKAAIPITQQVAGALNQQQQADLADRDAAAANGQVLVTGLVGANNVPYVLNMTQFHPDDMASLFVPDAANAQDIGIVVPGSDAQFAAVARGVPAGQVQVKSINNRTGYTKVGSDGWIKNVVAWSKGRLPNVSRQVAENFLGQAAAYGYGPVFAEHYIQPVLNLDNNGNARFSLPAGVTIEQIANNKPFLRDIRTLYQAMGVDPAARQKGSVGALANALHHADSLNLTAPGADPAPLDQVNQALINQFAQTGSVRGAAHWAGNKTDFNNRRGDYSFPMVDANGRPLYGLQNPSAGKCTLETSGPGVAGGANANYSDVFGLRLYPKQHKHVSRGANTAGIEVAPTTWSCGKTSNWTTDLNRSVYKAGGARAAANEGARETLERRSALLNSILPPNLQNAFSPDVLDSLYQQWVRDPANTQGNNPFFMLPPSAGEGFSVAAPLAWEAQMRADGQDELADEFARTDLNQAARAIRGNALLDRLLGGGIPLTGEAAPTAFGKQAGGNPLSFG